jgi:hypothetical protein
MGSMGLEIAKILAQLTKTSLHLELFLAVVGLGKIPQLSY